MVCPSVGTARKNRRTTAVVMPQGRPVINIAGLLFVVRLTRFGAIPSVLFTTKWKPVQLVVRVLSIGLSLGLVLTDAMYVVLRSSVSASALMFGLILSMCLLFASLESL